MLATVHHGRTIYILGCNLLDLLPTKVGIGLSFFKTCPDIFINHISCDRL